MHEHILLGVSTRGCPECQGLWSPPDCQGMGHIHRSFWNCLGDGASDGTALSPPVPWYLQVKHVLLYLCMPATCSVDQPYPSSLEWAPLTSLVAKAHEPRGCLKRLSDTVRNIFSIANVTNPQDKGVIDHMVSVTTAMKSPFIAVTCHTVSN